MIPDQQAIAACKILHDRPPILAEVDVVTLHAIRGEAEAQRGITKAWLTEARGKRFTMQQKIDLALYDRVEAADVAWADRIRLVSYEFTRRKVTRSAAALKSHGPIPMPASPAIERAETERDEARESCRRLAAEVERLTEELATAKRSTADAALYRAFYESAQFILAESTFGRIRDKARQLIASVRAK